MKTRYWKVLRDLSADFGKNFMLVLAIAIGVCGIGSILGGYSVIKREMAGNYLGANPASATIEMEQDIPKDLIDSIKRMPGIEEAERHATIIARMNVNDRWYPLLLFVVDDFAHKQTNKIGHVSGATIPANGTMLVERSALSVMQAGIGEELTIKTPHGESKKVILSGSVHDPSLAPAWQEQAGYGYITLETLHWLGETQGFDQIRMLVSDNKYSRQYITDKATSLAGWLKQSGYTIHEIQVPPPGKHPHQSQMNAVITIFIIFSYMILILGSILVSVSMATLMVKQVRQIGIMKTIGANSFQVIRLYSLMMLIICVVALLIAIPSSRMVATLFYRQIAALLNLDIRDGSIPAFVLLIQIASGIIIPFIAASVPVIRGSIIPVRRALDNYGVSQKIKPTSWLIKLSRSYRLNETWLLAVRNVFRQRGRLVMTLALLSAGGAMFMAALNVSEAWNKNLSKIYEQRLYDMEVRLSKPIPAEAISSLSEMPGIKLVEGWASAATSFAKSNTYEVTHTYPDKGHGSFSMQALPVPTKMFQPTITEGKWLSNPAANEVVLNQSAKSFVADARIGDHVMLSIDGKPVQWTIVGFSSDVGSPATAYVPLTAFAKVTATTDSIKVLKIAYADRSKKNVMQKSREVEKLLEQKSYPVSVSMPVWLLQNAIAGHMKVLVNSLLSMALLMAIVGLLGLTFTISMNVMERTREIGVMRAIGATPKKIRMLITGEGFLIGFISIGIAFLLSLLLSFYLGRFIGAMAFRTPLSLTISLAALGIWILIVVAGSYLATYFPARKANRITTREALSYE